MREWAAARSRIFSFVRSERRNGGDKEKAPETGIPALKVGSA